jgi:ribosomal protein S18 acetylase RimI-like enzyme
LTTIEPVSADLAMTFKSVRLRALQDAPTAFASTYETESKLSDDEWTQRAIERGSGERSICYLVFDDDIDNDIAVGIAGGYFPDGGGGPFLVSMWVAPSHRRRAIGQQLVEAVERWARSRAAPQLVLEVTTTNEPAIRFYEKLGFRKTGRVQPYPNDPKLREYEMIKTLS